MVFNLMSPHLVLQRNVLSTVFTCYYYDYIINDMYFIVVISILSFYLFAI